MDNEITKTETPKVRPRCCATCLFAGVECKEMSEFQAVDDPDETIIICAHWMYYD